MSEKKHISETVTKEDKRSPHTILASNLDLLSEFAIEQENKAMEVTRNPHERWKRDRFFGGLGSNQKLNRRKKRSRRGRSVGKITATKRGDEKTKDYLFKNQIAGTKVTVVRTKSNLHRLGNSLKKAERKPIEFDIDIKKEE